MISSNVTVEMGPLSPVPFWKNAALAAGAMDSALLTTPATTKAAPMRVCFFMLNEFLVVYF
jgi:hypothetical protein